MSQNRKNPLRFLVLAWSLAIFGFCRESPRNVPDAPKSWADYDMDFDGDGKRDELDFEYTGGAHCCYKPRLRLSSTGKEYRYPFELDGGFGPGMDPFIHRPWPFNIKDYDGDGRPEIYMRIFTYNYEINEIPPEVAARYGLRTNYVIIDFKKGKPALFSFPRHTSVEQYFYSRKRAVATGPLSVEKSKNKFCYVDQNGALAILCDLDEANEFSQGIAIVRLEKNFYFIDTKGKIVREFGEFAVIPRKKFSASGFILVDMGGDRWSFLDAHGKAINSTPYSDARPFSEGLAGVQVDEGKWGYIDTGNRWFVKPCLDEAFSFRDGAAEASVNGRRIRIERKGATFRCPK